MKKVMFVSLGVLILTLAFVGGASANMGPHGNYDKMTDACAGCHRAHTGQNADLLVYADEYEVCMICHGNDAGGANTNVEGGIFMASATRNAGTDGYGTLNRRLNGGSFDADGTGLQGVQTSAHNVQGLGGDGWGTAWGGTSFSAGLIGQLECTSCHNPHGSNNYRLLKNDNATWLGSLDTWSSATVKYNVASVPASLEDVSRLSQGGDGSKDYTHVADTLLGTDWTSGTYATGGMKIQTAYAETISRWCGVCHTNYVGNSTNRKDGWGTQAIDYGDGRGDVSPHSHSTYRQSDFGPYYGWTSPNISPLPMALNTTADVNASSNRLTCLTCHFAHGSTKTMSGFASAAQVGGHDTDVTGPAGNLPTGDSALLFYENRGMCQACHKK